MWKPPGGGPSAAPVGPPKKSPPRKKRQRSEPDARSPDEDGMLQMVPLTDSGDDDDGPPKSATQFFAIPSAKKKRPAGGSPPTPAPTAARPAGGGAIPVAVPGGPPPGAGPGGAPPGAPPMGGSMPPGPVGIQGPVASGPVASGPTATQSGSATPFAVGAQPEPAADDNRGSSFRVYAIVLGLFGLAFVAMVVAVAALLLFGGFIKSQGDDGVASDTEVTQEAKSDRPRVVEDTAPDEVEIPDAPVRRPTRPRPSGTTSAPATPAPRPRAAGPAKVTIKIAPGTPTTSVEIKCPGGFRERGTFANDVAVVNSVPQELCEVHFKGGAPAKFKPVSGGDTKTCSFQGTTAVCR